MCTHTTTRIARSRDLDPLNGCGVPSGLTSPQYHGDAFCVRSDPAESDLNCIRADWRAKVSGIVVFRNVKWHQPNSLLGWTIAVGGG